MLAAFVACTAASLLLAAANESFRYEERLGDTVALLLAFSAFSGQPDGPAGQRRPVAAAAGGPGRPRPTATLRP
jgi:hypothetical protein